MTMNCRRQTKNVQMWMNTCQTNKAHNGKPNTNATFSSSFFYSCFHFGGHSRFNPSSSSLFVCSFVLIAQRLIGTAFATGLRALALGVCAATACWLLLLLVVVFCASSRHKFMVIRFSSACTHSYISSHFRECEKRATNEMFAPVYCFHRFYPPFFPWHF